MRKFRISARHFEDSAKALATINLSVSCFFFALSISLLLSDRGKCLIDSHFTVTILTYSLPDFGREKKTAQNLNEASCASTTWSGPLRDQLSHAECQRKWNGRPDHKTASLCPWQIFSSSRHNFRAIELASATVKSFDYKRRNPLQGRKLAQKSFGPRSGVEVSLLSFGYSSRQFSV